jgi:hypothetical protein
LFVVPNPTSDAKLPATEIVSVLFCAAITKWPLLSSHAVACAFFGPLVLMAPMRSATVSVPVEV